MPEKSRSAMPDREVVEAAIAPPAGSLTEWIDRADDVAGRVEDAVSALAMVLGPVLVPPAESPDTPADYDVANSDAAVRLSVAVRRVAMAADRINTIARSVDL